LVESYWPWEAPGGKEAVTVSKIEEETAVKVTPFLETLDNTQLKMFLDIMNWMVDRGEVPNVKNLLM
jgi:hypothetical protein